MTFTYDVMGRRMLRQNDDGTWTRYFYDGLNVLLERESPYDPSTWGAFVGEDAEDGDTNGWYAWNGTTLSNTWRAQRRSRVVTTSNSTADATRAIVGDDYNNGTNPNASPWNAARRALTLALQRVEAGLWSLNVYCSTDHGGVRVAY
jgi:hypothetical protein